MNRLALAKIPVFPEIILEAIPIPEEPTAGRRGKGRATASSTKRGTAAPLPAKKPRQKPSRRNRKKGK